MNFVFDFGSLQQKDEEKYIKNYIEFFLSKYSANGKDFNDMKNIIVKNIVECHKFIRENYDQSFISLRELKRFCIIFDYFGRFRVVKG